MTNQDTIPADKVRDILRRYDGGLTDQLENDLRALLPTPQPTTGLLGRWAKHPDYGDVMCVWDKPKDGWINIYKRANNGVTGAEWYQIRFSDLTFPHQATKPADVPADQPWLVDVEAAHVTEKNVMGVRNEDGDWRLYCREKAGVDYCTDEGITLVCPLTPERPETDLQAKSMERALDRMQAKYQEAQERIKELERASTPRTVTTEQEYVALPVGSKVSVDGETQTWEKTSAHGWKSNDRIENLCSNAFLGGTTRTVLRYGWGDEQPKPAWWIEHDWQNLKAGEYAIDKEGYDGIIRRKSDDGSYWLTDESWVFFPEYAPFIVFPSVDAATPEAIEEAKKARDKEIDK